MAALLSLVLAACGGGQGVEAATTPSAGLGGLAPVLAAPVTLGQTNPNPSTWLSDEPLDQVKAFADGLDLTGLVKLTPQAPYNYEAGKRFGSCTVIYRSFNSGDNVLFEVVIKPFNAHTPGLRAEEADSWIAIYKQDCSA